MQPAIAFAKQLAAIPFGLAASSYVARLATDLVTTLGGKQQHRIAMRLPVSAEQLLRAFWQRHVAVLGALAMRSEKYVLTPRPTSRSQSANTQFSLTS